MQATLQSDVVSWPEEFESMLAMQGLDMPGIRRDQYKMQIDVQQTLWDGGKSRTDRAIAESEAAQERMSTLKSDEVLAVAFEYTYAGKTYQVGEFSTDKKEGSGALYVKLLKSNSSSPANATWDLMMKNIHYLGANSITSKDFRLDIQYESDSTSTNLTYLPEGNLKSKALLQLMNLDHLDAKQNANPNGFYDYVEGYTVQSSTGRIIFPVIDGQSYV